MQYLRKLIPLYLLQFLKNQTCNMFMKVSKRKVKICNTGGDDNYFHFIGFTNRKLRLKYNKHELDFEPSWKQSLEKLNSYMDILAPELLALWEMCEEVPLPLTAAPHQKVLNWLESAEMKPVIPSQEELDNVATPINTQELISVSQEIDITCLDDSNALQELLLPKVKKARKKENTRKRQKT